MIDARIAPPLRHRGFALTLILLIFTLGQPLSLASMCLYWYELNTLGEPVPFIDVYATIAIAFVALFALGGVWFWKRWGYIYWR